MTPRNLPLSEALADLELAGENQGRESEAAVLGTKWVRPNLSARVSGRCSSGSRSRAVIVFASFWRRGKAEFNLFPEGEEETQRSRGQSKLAGFLDSVEQASHYSLLTIDVR